MAITNPPYVCQGRTDHPAALFRMALAAVQPGPMLVGATSPVGGVNINFGNALQVTGLASMNVQVGTGFCLMPNSTSWNGMYGGYNASTLNLSISAASSTQWRTDRVDAVVVDPGDNTANWTPVVTIGTLSSSAPGATPAAPANSTPLALVRVVPNMTVTNGGGTVVDNRVYQTLPGVWPTTSTNRPSLSDPEGMMWFETDTNLLGIIVNGTYEYILLGTAAPDTWHDFRPANAGFNGSNSGEYPPQYRKTPDGMYVEFMGSVGLPASGMNATNVFTNAMPAGYRPNHHSPIPAVCSNSEVVDFNILTNGMIQLGGFTGSGSGVLAYLNGRIPLDVSGLIQS